jgi:tRNA threonylcarbamoyladenosine biosynthesis protein TsaB
MTNGLALQRFSDAPRVHTQLLLAMVDELLHEATMTLANVDAIAFGRGPGSFTGIRIAASMAQGLAFAAEKLVLPISTLAALAQTALENHSDQCQPDYIISAIDARMNELYWACYRRDRDGLVSLYGDEHLSAAAALVLDPTICSADNTAAQNVVIWGAGTGWQYVQDIPSADCVITQYPNLLPNSLQIARLARRDFLLGLAVKPEDALPVYLRDNVAWAKKSE